MSVATTASTVTLPAPTLAPTRPVSRTTAFAALSRRRVALSAHTPRELLVPLVTPILFADVIAPALAKTMGVFRGIDYVSFVAVGTIGLLVPLACVLGGVGMIVDRQSGSQRDLLAAPIPRSLLVLGNLSVALVVSALQVAALFAASVLRGADFHVTASGVLWAGAAVLALAIAMHGVAVVLRRVVLPHQRHARRPDRVRQGAPADARVGGAALRAGRRQGHRPARHLGHEQRDRDGRAEPHRRRRLRWSHDRRRHPGVHPLGDQLIRRRVR